MMNRIGIRRDRAFMGSPTDWAEVIVRIDGNRTDLLHGVVGTAARGAVL